MHTISISRTGLSIDGQPWYLLSGCIHYFRYPQAEWRDLLQTARAGGLNTIDTVIPWNRHEPLPGQFDFAAEADLPAFLDLCAAMGLYVIVRPGPYICAEWENGGLPAWLTAQEGVELRVDNPIYLEATLRWFDRLMPILAQRQITRGGPIILCQIENEHWASGRYGHDQHQHTLAQAAIARGMEVPQYTCMGATRDWPEFRNGWSGIAEKLQQTRALWPDNPMIVSELWSGWFDNWGASRHTQKTAARLDMVLHQLTAVGASGLSHWMWAGGTNFGYWGGRTVGGDTIHMTTSYDYDAPVGEYGELHEKFFVARRHHLFLATLGAELSAVLADAQSGGPQVIAPPAVKGRSEGGGEPYRNLCAAPSAPAAWRNFTATFLHNPSLEGQSYQVFLQHPPRHLAVEVEAASIKPIFSNLPLASTGITLDFHTSRILGFWQRSEGDLLVCYGFAGELGELQLSCAAGNWNIAPNSAAQLNVNVHATQLHLRYWISERPTRLQARCGNRQLQVLLLTQAQAERFEMDSLPLEAAHQGQAERQIPLHCTALSVRECETNAGWQPIAQPQPLEHLECYYGYGWYRATFKLDQPLATTLCAPWLSDRARVLLDGYDCGVLGVHPDGPRLALPITLEAGHHDLRLLVDNLGRFNYGSNTGERKGLLDTLYWGGQQYDISAGWCALWQEAVFAGEAIANARPSALRPDASGVHLGNFAFQGPALWLLREFVAQPDRRYILQLTGDRNPGALFINGVCIERFSRHHGGGFFKHDISQLVHPGVNVIALHIQGYAGIAWRATLLEYDAAQPLAAMWSFCPGVSPGEPGGNGQAGMAFYRASFALDAVHNPAVGDTASIALKLRPAGLGKGQIWLNGQNVGRYWQIGPQESYKLPLSWLQAHNELLIFTEEGGDPSGIELVLR